MITVRFSSGFSIQYNDATYAVNHSGGFTDVYTKKDGQLIAQAPSTGCVIEWVAPCRTYNPIAPDSDRVTAEIELLRKEIRSLSRKIAKVAK